MGLLSHRRRRRTIAREADSWHARMLEPASEAEVEAFEAWLNADPDHPLAYASVEADWARAARLSPRLLPPPAAKRFDLRPAFGAALAAGVAVAAMLWLSGGGPGAPSAAEAALSNPGPGIRSVRLADGSTLKLDKGAMLTMLMSPDTRRIRVRTGRARFAVARDPSRVFTVVAQGTTVHAEAGVFDVTATGTAVRVQVLEGAVSVASSRPDENGEAVLPLESGHSMEVRGGRAQQLSPDPRDAHWTDNRVSFTNAPLANVVAVANGNRSPAILIDDEEVGRLKVSGVLDLRDPVSLARKLATALDLQIEHRHGAMLLSR